MDNGDTIQVRGKGGADVDRSQPGDLFVDIKVHRNIQLFSVLIHVLILCTDY